MESQYSSQSSSNIKYIMQKCQSSKQTKQAQKVTIQICGACASLVRRDARIAISGLYINTKSAKRPTI